MFHDWNILKQTVAREIKTQRPHSDPSAEDAESWPLVGPTGVGKTTTIAKLAAGFRVRAQRRVGLSDDRYLSHRRDPTAYVPTHRSWTCR